MTGYGIVYGIRVLYDFTRLDCVEDSNQSVLNVGRTLKTVCSRSRTVLF